MSLTKLLENSLDEVLTRGYFKKEVKLSEKLSVTITTISEEDLIDARMSIPKEAKSELFTYTNFEKFEILSRAIIEVNKETVLELAEKEFDLVENKNNFISAKKFAVISVRNFLGKLPPSTLDYLSNQYNELTKQQSDYLSGKIGEDIENF